MVRAWSYAAIAALTANVAMGYDAVKCSTGSKCPSSLPCCSQYGECGVGAYCLGGCDPLSSNTLDSCVPAPVCKSDDYKLTSLDGITDKTKYLGDATKSNWVVDGTPLAYQDQVLLTMAPKTVGTVMASSHYVWYGSISATMKTSRGAGVVSAFILLSDVKDEIDYEFVGVDLESAQTNYYFQGITNYNNGGNISVTDTFNNYHTYTIDWTPDQITWSIDGKVGRTKKKSDTWNSTANRYDYPQTPARIQLSIWPGGLASNAAGTISWAGGPIDWSGPDIKSNGYYYATVNEVKVQCYDAPGNVTKSGSTSYIYADSSGMEGAVQITDKGTVLKSLLGTGVNMTADLPTSSASNSEIANIPGLNGGGPGLFGGYQPDGSSGANPTKNANPTAFNQGSSGSKSGAIKPEGERILKGSLFAGLIAVVGTMIL
ncbi:hypothetical protein FGG08_007270 [Glutinoglossum americanum]|uniref:GH16 domain-containing protein n=1 Tax=Glutinoglossum americanum TaxID=1670608 RepID=A0A9P8I5P6_9PEZI|nr:hypothetical protein FGG08_007270 [Glutinoglossum americanum]